MLDSLKNYLTVQGFEPVFLDMMPDAGSTPEATGILEWNNTRSQPVGETTHYIQIQVRRLSYDSAKTDCRRILSLLDSGPDERLIPLDETTTCLSRVRRGPLLLKRGTGYTTFSGEIAVWMNNE